MENITNETNQNHLDGHQEIKIQNVNGNLTNESDSSVFVEHQTQVNGFKSTSPSKQKVNAAISEVINDRLLPSESQKKDLEKEVVNEVMNDVMNSVEESVTSSVNETNDNLNVDLKSNEVESHVNNVNNKEEVVSMGKDTSIVNVDKSETADIDNNILSNSQNSEQEGLKNEIPNTKECLLDAVNGSSENTVLNKESNSKELNVDTVSDSEVIEPLECVQTDDKQGAPKVDSFDSKIETADISSVIHEQPTKTTYEVVDKIESKGEMDAENNTDNTSKIDVDSKETKRETEIKINEWLDILGNGLLKKKVLKAGLGRDSRPEQGDIVNIRCEGKLEDGTVVDKHSDLQMVLGDADVIQALDMCIALMEDKETCTLFTDSRYAYSIFGRLDYVPAIPKTASITYVVEILSVTKGKNPSEMEPQDCILHSENKRQRGNDLYSRGDFSGAIDVYKRAFKYLEGKTEKELMNMKVKCLNNLSAAQLQVKAYTVALQSLEVVLGLEPANIKALFRKAKCLEAIGKDNEALKILKKAVALDPTNKLINQDIARLRSKVSMTQEKEKKIYQKMFQQNKKADGAKNENENEDEEAEEEEDDTSYVPLIGSVAVGAAALIGGLMWYRYH